MYLVRLREYPNSNPIVIHAPFTDGLKLVGGDISQSLNNITGFDFEMDLTNPGYTKIRPMQSLIDITNVKNGREEFRGRIINYADSMDTSGMHTKKVVCEGGLGYLHDSYQPYISFDGKATDLFKQMINNHNAQVEPYKRYKIGSVSLSAEPKLRGFITPEHTTFEILKDRLLSNYGEVNVETIGSEMVISYVDKIGYDSREEIGISRNLKSITKKVDPSKIVTRLVPLGAVIPTEDPADWEKRTTVESVNGGVIYLERQDLKNEFGIQAGSIIWDDVTIPDNLKTKGVAWLNDQKVVMQQFTVEAIDLFKIGKGVDEYRVGNTHKVINPIMSINERIRVVAKSVDIINPVNSALTIGDKFKTLADYQMEQRNAVKDYNKLQNIINEQRGTISGLTNQINNVQNVINNSNVNTLPADLQFINTQLENIKSDIKKIPTYGLATTTANGLMSSADKFKTDFITVTKATNLDTIATKTGFITVTKAVDLDSLVARVVALEKKVP